METMINIIFFAGGLVGGFFIGLAFWYFYLTGVD